MSLKRADAILRIINESLATEAEAAAAAGKIGFLARMLVMATLPHSRPKEHDFVRRNGAFTLTMMAPPRIGLPYGVIPRLLLAWLSTECVKTQSRELVLGESLSAFMRELGMVPTGGRWGSITRLREQSRRLFTTSISCAYQHERGEAEMGFRLADRHVLWWNLANPEQRELFSSIVVLSEGFYNEIVNHPVPVNLNALRKLRGSSMRLDLYSWLSYRMSYLRRNTVIPWVALQAQFGSEYGRSRDFKAAFTEHLAAVLGVYKQARVVPTAAGLLLKPSPTHVPPQRRITT